VFITLGGGLLITTAGFTLSSSAGIAGRIGSLCFGALCMVLTHGFFFLMEKKDTINRDTPWLKQSQSAQALSNQIIQKVNSAKADNQKPKDAQIKKKKKTKNSKSGRNK